MSDFLDVRYDDAKIKQLERELRGIPRALPRVMSRGLNRTATQARTQISRSLAKRTGLRVKDVRQRTILKKASYVLWRAKVQISNKRLRIIDLKAREKKPQGVTYKDVATRKRVLIRHAFIATGSKRGTEVWLRSIYQVGHRKYITWRGREMEAIYPQRGPSLSEVFTGAQDEANRVYQESLARLEKNIHDQVNLILSRRLPA